MRRLPISWLLVGAGTGAATMYLFDPDRGRRRRHNIQNRFRGTVHEVEHVARKAQRDFENRRRGLAARTSGSRSSLVPQLNLFRQGMPERRLIEGGAGALLGAWGLLRGGIRGALSTVLGSYLLACAKVPRQNGVIRVQKTLTIEAPIDQVFRFWSNFQSFPQFMDHVLEVRTEGDRSHWRVSGPAGVPIEWDADVIERVDNRKIAWRSLRGSSVDHHGEVHFEPVSDRATRISVHMAYDPPGGPLGHAVAGFLLGDPKTLMDEDLLRLKSLLETGKTTAHARSVTAPEVQPT
jgi:uncharacterized membrane protein